MHSKRFKSIKLWSVAALLAVGALSVFSISGCDSSTSPGGNDSAELLLTYPKGGETFHVGDTMKITWTVTGKVDLSGPLNLLDVQLSPDSGKTWAFLPGEENGFGPTTSPFKWVVTDSISYSGLSVNLVNKMGCEIKLEQYSTADSNQIGISKPFTVVQ